MTRKNVVAPGRIGYDAEDDDDIQGYECIRCGKEFPACQMTWRRRKHRGGEKAGEYYTFRENTCILCSRAKARANKAEYIIKHKGLKGHDADYIRRKYA